MWNLRYKTRKVCVCMHVCIHVCICVCPNQQSLVCYVQEFHLTSNVSYLPANNLRMAEHWVITTSKRSLHYISYWDSEEEQRRERRRTIPPQRKSSTRRRRLSLLCSSVTRYRERERERERESTWKLCYNALVASSMNRFHVATSLFSIPLVAWCV